MDDFHGARALVTGASRGLGRAYALELARRGARLILLARSENDLAEVAALIRERYPRADVEVLAGDLTAPEGADEVLRELAERALTVDLLINNAGSGGAGAFLSRPLDRQLGSVDLNVRGLMVLTHGIGNEMVSRGSGGIINVASTAAFQPLPYQAVYSATKAFVLFFTEGLAEELRGTGVHVMAAHPGAIATGFFDGTSATVHPSADTPEYVASRTLDDYAARRAASYPGSPVTRLMTWPARLLPRATTARLGGWFNRRLGLHEVVDLAPSR